MTNRVRRTRPRRWVRVGRRLYTDTRIARLQVWWQGCLKWSRTNWMNEQNQA